MARIKVTVVYDDQRGTLTPDTSDKKWDLVQALEQGRECIKIRFSKETKRNALESDRTEVGRRALNDLLNAYIWTTNALKLMRQEEKCYNKVGRELKGFESKNKPIIDYLALAREGKDPYSRLMREIPIESNIVIYNKKNQKNPKS